MKLLDFGVVRCCNKKVIDVDADDAVRLIEDTIVGLGHGKAVSHQDTVYALVPDPWCLLQSVQRASKTANVSVFFKALWQLHVDRLVDITVQEGSDGIELAEFPSAQHGTCNDAAD